MGCLQWRRRNDALPAGAVRMAVATCPVGPLRRSGAAFFLLLIRAILALSLVATR